MRRVGRLGRDSDRPAAETGAEAFTWRDLKEAYGGACADGWSPTSGALERIANRIAPRAAIRVLGDPPPVTGRPTR